LCFFTIWKRHYARERLTTRRNICVRSPDQAYTKYLQARGVIPVELRNHVHLLVAATIPRAKWLGSLKGFTAYGCNKILGRTGTPFWQDESYDHEVGLAESPQDYRYSSASQTRPRL
jgi:hypothetical protein